jgi:hypothetical protein
METIKLKEIFESKAFYNHCLYDLDVNQKNCILDIMQEACNQSIEQCETNAKFRPISLSELNLYENYIKDWNAQRWIVDNNSILNTKSQVENVPFLK